MQRDNALEQVAPGRSPRVGAHRAGPCTSLFMSAGQAFWKRGAATYEILGPGGRYYHPSMMPHANKTGEVAFLSAYVWHGDVSTEQYVYDGYPDA